jgi:hypothetical protein
MASVIIFPNAIEKARGRLVFARIELRQAQRAAVGEETYQAYLEARQAYQRAWVHWKAVARV